LQKGRKRSGELACLIAWKEITANGWIGRVERLALFAICSGLVKFFRTFSSGKAFPKATGRFPWSKYMKKIGLIVFAVAIVIGVAFANFTSWGKASGKIFNFSINFKGEKGSGNVRSEIRDLRDFNSVDVGGVFQVEITAQKDFSVEVEADDNLLQYIKTEVRGGRLEISMDRRVKTSNPLRVRIGAPNIEKLEASGVANVTVINLKNSDFAVDTSGASKLNISGETQNLTVDVSGATEINAEDLKAVNANVDASGASRVNVNVSGELKTDASGASKINYAGTPTNVIKKTSGASSVNQR